MKVEVLESSDRYLELRLDDCSTAVVNSLRRTLMMEVPKLAIEDVTIYDNKSALFDEIVSHRLGLLPVPTDLKAMEFRDECTCEGEGCANCTVLFTLTFEGPGVVYARDLQPVTPEHVVAEPDVPIVKLGRDQRLMLEATAELGTGAKHAKWQPVAGVGYREVPTLKIKGNKLQLEADQLSELASLAPEGAIEFDGQNVKVLDEIKAHDLLYNVGGKFGIDNVEYGIEPGSFIFQFETDGSLTAKEAFQEALRILMEKLKAVEEGVAELK